MRMLVHIFFGALAVAMTYYFILFLKRKPAPQAIKRSYKTHVKIGKQLKWMPAITAGVGVLSRGAKYFCAYTKLDSVYVW